MQDTFGQSVAGRFLRSKLAKVVFLFDALLLVAFLLFSFFRGSKNVEIMINVAPVDAKILINGRQVSNNESYFYTPGKYDVVISRDGLQEKSFSIEAKAYDAVNMSVFLKDEDFSFYSMRDNVQSFYKLREIASGESNRLYDNDKSAEAFIKKTWHAYSLVMDVLPITETYYKDGTAEYKGEVTIKAAVSGDCKKLLCLEVISSHVNNTKGVAKNILTDKGYNIEDYDIAYKEF